jgi:hypothetical protein
VHSFFFFSIRHPHPLPISITYTKTKQSTTQVNGSKTVCTLKIVQKTQKTQSTIISKTKIEIVSVKAHLSESIWGRMSNMAIIPSSKNFWLRTRCYKGRISIQKWKSFRINCCPPNYTRALPKTLMKDNKRI